VKPYVPTDPETGTPNEIEDAQDRRRAWARDLFGRFITLRWVPLTAALLSLPLSAAAIFLSVQQPDVVLILPDQIRVAQGRESGSAYVYLQPAFVSTGKNERIEVVRDMELVVQPPTGESARFRWDQQLRLVTDPDSGGLRYEYVADAVPLLIGPRDASAPLSLFDAPSGWFFVAGDYTFTLIAERVVVGQPLQDDFRLTLAQSDIEFLDRPGPDQFLTLPIATR
jgi:hypothetical protein